MTHSDTANNNVGDSKNLLTDGIQLGSAKSDHFDGLNIPKENEFSVRSALLEDAVIMESIEREAFPGWIPLSRISRDITRDNGLYLNAVRRWRSNEKKFKSRLMIATKAEKEDGRFSARVKRSVIRYFLFCK